ncbi:MAG TPA: nucleotide exchange factor GrpE [Aequorivita sp.]|jgi:molecular chaperone GrpE|nr:nucleotide exchange factor GrpE [Aequorivita sp.]MBP42028.1 nucleotide exchange factor GrpE [Aequorivita sp.]HBC04635.1 nucleotide exchange factor GrpE [Aequorivita sp.]HNP68376.1 nucleotide exchange factor GrpE [Aequorivita sp.]|tara:strand:- start:9544 stop:10143 length:600 start_codon:yes stop_codon:yes gene_type:complete
MAVLLLPSEKIERKASMGKNDKMKETEYEEEVGFDETDINEQEAAQEKVTDALSELEEEFQREKDRYLRLFAEFENFKKRTARERVDMFKTAGADVIGSLLPVLDDFERALKEIEKSEDDSLLKGVELIHNKLRETLKSKGLHLMDVKPGDAFDADSHEAITQIPAPEDKLKGKIIDVVEKGYTLGDKIIRYPKVVIGQ